MLQCNVCFQLNSVDHPLGRTAISERGITRTANGVIARVVCDGCLEKKQS
jgi:hypothetical protein